MAVHPVRPGPPSRGEKEASKVRFRRSANRWLASNGGNSHLEIQALAPTTADDCERRPSTFRCYFAPCVADPPDVNLLEPRLLEYSDVVFLDKMPLDAGTKLRSAVGHRLAALQRPGAQGALPRARRTLQRWNRLEPWHARLPLPWVVLLALAARFPKSTFLGFEISDVALAQGIQNASIRAASVCKCISTDPMVSSLCA